MILRDEPCLSDVVVARDGEGDTSRPVAPCVVAFQVVWSMDEPHARYVSPAMLWNEANHFARKTDTTPGLYAEEIRPVWGWPKDWFSRYKVELPDPVVTRAERLADFVGSNDLDAALEWSEWVTTLDPEDKRKATEAFAPVYESARRQSARTLRGSASWL